VNHTYEPQVADAIRSLTARIEAEIPELGEVIRDARNEDASEQEVMRRAMAAVIADPNLAKRLEALAAEAFAPLRGEMVPTPTSPHVPANIVVEPPFGVGRPRLNPNYEAAVMERLSFDGDAPELRFGAMPEGGRPAVPVDTDARNPVAIGWMLEKAAEEVASEMRQIAGVTIAEVQEFLTEEDSAELEVRGQQALQKLDRNNLPEPEGYKRGQLAAHRDVEAPDGGDLATLTVEQRGQLAWKFLSTTQGRRSATRAIRDLVYTKLRSDGHAVVLGNEEPSRVSRPEDVLVHATWTVELSGPHATQSSFAFVDTAAHVLIHKLEAELDEGGGSGATLEVIPVNTVEVRKVGWAARLLRSKL